MAKMAKNRKEEYKEQNLRYLEEIASQEGVKKFDNSYERNCPEAFRLNQVIEGWQIALQQMHVGDKWIIYIPYTVGYGNRASGPIPAFSTLIFEVELLGIA